MLKLLKKKYDYIDKLIQNKRFNEALTELEDINPSLLDGEDYACYCLFRAEAELWLGNYRIDEILIKAIQFFKGSSNNELYARSKYVYGCQLVSLGKHLEAREVLMESYLNFKRCDNLKAVSRVLNRLAFVQFNTGAVNDAISSLNQSININRELGNWDNIVLLQRNLASVYFMSGSLNKAIKIFKRKNGKAEIRKEQDQFRYYLRYSMALALLGYTDKAETIISKTVALSNEFRREKASYYEYLGWIYYLDGKFKAAEKTLKTGIELSMKIAPESALISQTKRLLADAYIGQEKFDKAQKTAEEALVVAEKINERVEIAGCYRVFARVATHDREQEQAREWYRKACEISALIQSRYELAVTRYLMATSGLYDAGERSALLYMAREYFVSENVKPYIKKVDKAISENPRPRKPTIKPEGFEYTFIAIHSKTKKIVELAENIAPADMNVLLTGPTGCGKDQLARYIHACSGRAGRLVTINSAAIPESMIESELFGYKKGAFTGADRDKTGLFELADNGTFYLNEIADSTMAFQAKLLEVIETKTVRRLGDGSSRKINIRIIAATNHDLEKQIRERKFRLDLYHRLNEIPIKLSALSERLEDIPELVKYFLKSINFNGNFKTDEFRKFCQYLSGRDWLAPDSGNVRELKSMVNRIHHLAKGDLSIMIDLLKDYDKGNESERDDLIRALIDTDWNQRETARLLGLTEGGVRYRIKKYKLKKEDFIKTGA